MPENLQEIASRHLNAAALLQRQDMAKASLTLIEQIKGKGLIVSTPDTAAFREVLRQAGFYADWREKYGPEAWVKLEDYTGRLT